VTTRVPLAALALAAACAAAACAARESPTPAPDPERARCREPAGEFGAAGCAVVRGRVLDGEGRPIPGAALSGIVLAREGCDACNSPGLVIDGEGTFSATVHWFAGGLPDSASATVRVAGMEPRFPRDGDRPAVQDSARVVLRFAPTGAAVRPADVVLRLRAP
jgi:hypothetical protein